MKDEYYKYNGNGRIVIPNNDIIKSLPKDGGKYWNRLIFENSPYLLQHAANPVDWYPWSEEAFKIAKELDRPIFLSIGYTTCHWCHVMEHESFEDLEVAKMMNDVFINIKVDREERPDIDNVYMEVTQMINGRGGWPMTVIMTPDAKPFFAGTYFPKTTRSRRTGMLELIPSIKKMWLTKRDSLLSDSEDITKKLLMNQDALNSKQTIKEDILDRSFNYFVKRYDSKYGGFGESPKFPKPHDYMFLSRYYAKTNNPKALDMVEFSLRNMRLGGLYDQIGYGFHRYSTDSKWLVPHFEKMLYDQAMLMHAYLDAYLVSNNKFYKDVVDEIITYVLRDMTSDKGGFYSAEDADSEGDEGVFYVWNKKEIHTMFSESDADLIIDYYNLTDEGNWSHGRRHGQTNILHIKEDTLSFIKKYNMSKSLFIDKMNDINLTLFEKREKRVHPQKDDKILTDWNGMMISALARAARILDNENYGNAAIKAMDFILLNLSSEEGSLLKRYRNGHAGLDGVLDDYAYTIWGLIELYQYNFNPKYLEKAILFSDYQTKHFLDKEKGGFYFNSDISEELLIRSKEIYDGAIPSGNAVSTNNFIKLGRLLYNTDYEDLADNLLEAFGAKINSYGPAYSQNLLAIDFIEGPTYEIVIVGNNSKKVDLILKELHNHKHDRKVIIHINDTNRNKLVKIIPFLDNFPAHDDNDPWIYVCKNFACELPTQNIDKVKDLLNK
jgi:uncharacterized protein YyaL (SSP411 family)